MTLARNSDIEIADWPNATPAPGFMTEDDFEHWVLKQEHGHFEWVSGKVVSMSPAGNDHDDIDTWLTMLLRHFTEEKDLGIVRSDVMFKMPGRRRTPDVFFLHKDNIQRLRPTRLDGPPDLAVEIVSPSSEGLDWRDKYLEYQSAGVKEYWVIDPRVQAIECYTLSAGQQYERILEADGKINSIILPGLYLKPTWLWQRPLPRVIPLLRGMGVDL